MTNKIRVGAVSYLNTKPLLYGLESPGFREEIILSLDHPAALVRRLKDDEIDLALMPVAAIPEVPGAQIVSDYGICADGKVVSVALFSQVPLPEIEKVYLDYQSRTSVRLVQLLFEKHWKKKAEFIQAPEDYIKLIKGKVAGVIIGDRALAQLPEFPFVFDLAAAWKDFTGLPFVFAAWIARKPLSKAFLVRFNEANAKGLNHLDEIAASISFSHYDLAAYFRNDIVYYIDEEKKRGLATFLKMIQNSL